jgi:hypothetical protein
MLRIVIQLAILWRGVARGGSWVMLSPWLWFWWVLIAVGSTCLCRWCAAGNGAGGGIISGQGRGGIISGQERGLETFSGHARGKHELLSAGVFPPRRKPSVVIADIPSPLAKHHRPSRYACANDMCRPGRRTAQACWTVTHFLFVGRYKQTRTGRLRWQDASAR